MYSELYKDTTGTGNSFARLNPYTSGSFSVSYIALKTMFTPVKPNEVTHHLPEIPGLPPDTVKTVGRTKPLFR